jgi:enoyl-CoA hydratase/carnithine racemase
VSPINASCDNDILRLTLANPAAGNLLDDAMLAAILQALQKWKQARVVVISAQGKDFSIGRPKPRASSGLDEATGKKVRAALEMVHAVNMKLRDWPGVTLAVLRGQANGAAAGLVINCDVVVAEPDAAIGYAEINYDLPPAIVASYLPNRIAPRVAQYMLLTGSHIDMNRALSWGLVHELHTADKLEGRVEELVSFLVARAPGAIDHCKQSLYAFVNQEHAIAGPRGIDRVVEWLCRPVAN